MMYLYFACVILSAYRKVKVIGFIKRKFLYIIFAICLSFLSRLYSNLLPFLTLGYLSSCWFLSFLKYTGRDPLPGGGNANLLEYFWLENLRGQKSLAGCMVHWVAKRIGHDWGDLTHTKVLCWMCFTRYFSLCLVCLSLSEQCLLRNERLIFVKSNLSVSFFFFFAVCCVLWDLSSLTRVEPGLPAVEVQSPNHWPSGIPVRFFFYFSFSPINDVSLNHLNFYM